MLMADSWRSRMTVPTPNTRRVNMTFDFGPGVTIPMRGNNALRTGVWLYHFSDGTQLLETLLSDGAIGLRLLHLPQLLSTPFTQATRQSTSGPQD